MKIKVRLVLLVVVGMITVSHQGIASSGTVTGSYMTAAPVSQTQPDVTGSGSANAQAAATVAGVIGATVSASSNRPVGYVVHQYAGVGGNSAYSQPSISHSFYGLSAGQVTVTAVFNIASFSAPTASYDPPVLPSALDSWALSYLVAQVQATFYQDCAQLNYTSVATQAYITTTGTLALSASLNAPTSGCLYVTGLWAAFAQAWGNAAYASASASGTLTSLSYTSV